MSPLLPTWILAAVFVNLITLGWHQERVTLLQRALFSPKTATIFQKWYVHSFDIFILSRVEFQPGFGVR